MTDARPKHKPNEKHTLDEVLKSLNDLVRNKVLEQPARAPAAPAPPPKPAAAPAAQKADMGSIINSLEELLSGNLNDEERKPRAKPKVAAPPPPKPAPAPAAKSAPSRPAHQPSPTAPIAIEPPPSKPAPKPTARTTPVEPPAPIAPPPPVEPPAPVVPPPKLDAFTDDELDLSAFDTTDLSSEFDASFDNKRDAPATPPPPTDDIDVSTLSSDDIPFEAELLELAAEATPEPTAQPPAAELSIAPDANDQALPAIEVEETAWNPDAEAAFAAGIANDLQAAAEEISAAPPPKDEGRPADAFSIDFAPGMPTAAEAQQIVDDLTFDEPTPAASVEFTATDSVEFTPAAEAPADSMDIDLSSPEPESLADVFPEAKAPAQEPPVTEEITLEAPAAKPTRKKTAPVAEALTLEAPPVKAPVVEALTLEAPLAKAPAQKKSVTETPVAQAPSSEAFDEPLDEALTLHDVKLPEENAIRPEDLEDLTPPLQEEDLMAAPAPEAAESTTIELEASPPIEETIVLEAPTIEAAPEPEPSTAPVTEEAPAFTLEFTPPVTPPKSAKSKPAPAPAPAAHDDIPVLDDVALASPKAQKLAPHVPAPANVRDMAIKIIAKLNIELRKSGEQPLSPKIINRLQQLLGEQLHTKEKK